MTLSPADATANVSLPLLADGVNVGSGLHSLHWYQRLQRRNPGNDLELHLLWHLIWRDEQSAAEPGETYTDALRWQDRRQLCRERRLHCYRWRCQDRRHRD